jgi:hypothetical protein
VDQLDATTPGFIAQLKGILTRKRYHYVTIIVDHHSKVDYIVPQVSLTSEETLRAKNSFETRAASHGVSIKNYHCDNRRFQDNGWKQDCAAKGQSISYCDVNAHWQNGIAEKRIRDLCEMANVNLNYAIKKWPKVINTSLWPYALRAANDANNAIPYVDSPQSPIKIFSNSTIRPSIRHHHPFGCPIYVLDGNLQSGNKAGKKWADRARLGVNLGFSPQHSKSVSLILSLKTGLVSPQYHCQFDEAFQTVDAALNPPSLWQEKAYFVEPKGLEEEKGGISEQATLPAGTVTVPLSPPESTNDAEAVTEHRNPNNQAPDTMEQAQENDLANNQREEGNQPPQTTTREHVTAREQAPTIIEERRTRTGKIIRPPNNTVILWLLRPCTYLNLREIIAILSSPLKQVQTPIRCISMRR